jgi:HEAT repeat protein
MKAAPVVLLLTATLAPASPALARGGLAHRLGQAESIRLLQHPELAVRVSAVRHLARQRPVAPATRAALERLLREHGADSSGVAALQALASLGAGAARPLLAALAIPDDDGPFERVLLRALGTLGDGAAEPLARQLAASPAVLVRRRAASALGRLASSPLARVALERALADPDEEVRAASADALPLHGRPAVAALVRALRDRTAKVQGTAAGALGALGPAATAAVPSLCQMLSATSASDVRLAAARALGQIAPRSRAARRALERALGDREETVRVASALALGASDRAALPALLRATRDAAEDVRAAVVRSLAELDAGAPRVQRALASARADRSEKVRCEAFDATITAARGSGAALSTLVAGLEDPDESVLRTISARLLAWTGNGSSVALAAIGRALGRRDLEEETRANLIAALARAAPDRRAALRALHHALRTETGDALAAAARGLGQLGGAAAPAVPELAALLVEDELDEVVVSATRALGLIGPRAVASVGAIEKLLDRSEPSLRQEAATALAAIGAGAWRARGTLERLAGDDSAAEVRLAATRALGALGVRAAIPVLLRLLADRDLELRAAAARALGELRAARAVPRLEAGLRRERIPVAAAVGALAAIGGDGVGALGRALSHPLPEVRRAAARAVTGLAAPARATLTALRRASGDADSEVRAEARAALAALGASGTTASEREQRAKDQSHAERRGGLRAERAGTPVIP